MNEIDIEAIKKRLAEAAPGPWRAAEAGSVVLDYRFMNEKGKPYSSYAEDACILGPDDSEVLGCSEWMRVNLADLEFMAHSRQDIQDLLGEIERLS